MATKTPANSAVIGWADVKDCFLRFYNGETPFTGLRHRQHGWRKGGNERWNGCSADAMADYLKNGFFSPEIAMHSAPYHQGADERRLIFSEEGELDLALAWSGHDYPYMEWQTDETKPGVKVVAEFGFSAVTTHTQIAEYGAWILSLLHALETHGYDIRLELTFTTEGQNSSVKGTELFQTKVLVKRANELLSLTDVSALFSPGGYRILMFMAAAMASDKVSARLDGTLGRCTLRTDEIDYDPESGTLRIQKSQHGGSWNRERMMALCGEALGITL